MPDPYSGDDDPLEFTIYQPDGETPLDLTNMGVTWALGDRVSGPTHVTKTTANTGEIAIVDAAGGRFDVLLDSADTADLSGSYYHEVEVTDVDDNDFTVFADGIYIKATLVD